MVRVFIILLLLAAGNTCFAQNSTVTVNDLLTLSSISPRNIESYLDKKGFGPSSTTVQNGVAVRTFQEKVKSGSMNINRSIDLYKNGDVNFIALKTSSLDEYTEGRSILKNAGFFYDRDTSRANSLVFKKDGITIQANSDNKPNSSPIYNFVLQKKEFPDPGPLKFAEDLLKFDSHDHLINYFGAENVKKDIYYFSENESTNCSVLYPNSSRQVMFIWEDGPNLFKISFIMISGVLQTTSTVQYNGNFSQNKWKFKSGIYLGMRIRDLLELNANDFSFYGRQSDYSFMVVPEKTRYIDFKTMGVLLDCFDCYNSPVLNTEKVSAATAADKDLSLYVSCIMISPQ